MKLTADDITGVVGIVPTPAKAGADRWDATNTVAFDQTEKMVRAVIDSGIDSIMTTGTFGECATLTWDELYEFIDCVVQTANRRVPVLAGVTTLNTRDTIMRAQNLMPLGVDGLFVGRPMWLPLDDAGQVRYYKDLAAALPGVPLVIYDNPGAFKGKISTEVYRALADIPEVVAAKHVGGPALESDLLAVGDRIRILPLESDWYALAEKHPELARACWSGNVACAPYAVAALRNAILAADWPRAKDLSERVNWAMAPLFPDGDLSLFMTYSIQLGHGRFAAAGLIDPGPCRPPYVEVPSAYLEGAHECGIRWAEIERSFMPAQAAS